MIVLTIQTFTWALPGRRLFWGLAFWVVGGPKGPKASKGLRVFCDTLCIRRGAATASRTGTRQIVMIVVRPVQTWGMEIRPNF